MLVVDRREEEEGEGSNRYVLFLVKLAELSFLSCCSCQKGVALRPRPAA